MLIFLKIQLTPIWEILGKSFCLKMMSHNFQLIKWDASSPWSETTRLYTVAYGMHPTIKFQEISVFVHDSQMKGGSNDEISLKKVMVPTCFS